MRNYKEYNTQKVMGSDSFTMAGFEDGYADLEDDSNNILLQLHGIHHKDELISYINNYLNGYVVGKFMSENAEKIYDEDGNLKEDEYCLEPCDSFNRSSAECLVKSFKK